MGYKMKNAPKLTAYLNILKSGKRKRTFLQNADLQALKQSNERRRQERWQRAVDNIPKTPQQYRERKAEQTDAKLQKSVLNEAQREEYAEKTAQREYPKQPAIARSRGEAAEAYMEKTVPGYKEEKEQYERYLKRQQKSSGQVMLERGDGPRKGYLDAEDYRKVRASKTWKNHKR